MNVLRKGCVGRSVAELQGMLNKQGYPTQADGIFGQQTYIAVCKLQQKCGLTVDGVVGKDTWNIIRGNNALSVSPAKTPVSVSAKIPATSELNYTETAILLGVEEAAIRAVSFQTLVR